MMKMKKLKLAIVTIPILILWMILSPTAFFGDFNKAHEQISEDGKYKVVAYYVLPATPVSFFQWAFEGDVFLVLYDAENNYLGQSSPFGFTDQYTIFGNDILFPDDADGTEKSLFLNGVNDFTEGYTIPVKNKNWWSVFYSLFY
ncbi:DUF6201 family protein [Lelliottia sp. WAP21]|uniref:DUF6201 family protein n=1 Tax=Lelliottia sp. WAP21 TaxID=2877426 RepID=UPI001E51F34C|nr:DUF6201 family protein [Lelliottia sp. WAP21]